MQTLTTFDAALKDLYSVDEVVQLAYADHPLLAMLSKKTDFTGRRKVIPIAYARMQARSRDFSKAQQIAASAYTRVTDFLLTRVKDYAIARIDGETMDATAGDAGAFLSAAKEEVDGAFDVITASLAHALYRSGTGVKATISSVSTVTATLADANDTVHFDVGSVVEVWDADATAILQANTFENRIVSAVNRQAGTVTLPAAWETVFNFTAASGDQIISYGDGEVSGSALSLTKVAGLEAWCPASAPLATSFFGVDRSVDTLRLGGIRSDGSSKDIEEAYIDAVTLMHREGGKAQYGFVTYEDWGALEKALGSRKVEVNVPVTTQIGFRGFQILGPKGPVAIIADQDAIPGVCHFVDMRYSDLHTLGMAPRLMNRQGSSEMLAISDQDGVEVRVGYYGNYATRAPGYNCRLTLPT